MKVLHVIDSLGRGGAEQQLVSLLPELARQGCPVEVAVLRGPYDLQSELEARGVPVHHLPTGHKWNLLRSSRSIARLARGINADTVHAHLYFPAVSVAMMRLLRMHKAQTFVTFHNLAYAGANRASLGLAVKKHMAAALYPGRIDGMFAVSKAVADHYRQALRLPHVEVVHNPVVIPAQVAVGKRSDSVPRIVLPGRLVPEKGHADLIQALTLLKMPVSVTFAGGGPLEAELQSASPEIRITGVLTHDRMLEEIAAADLVVIPSRFEGFGLTALEAMALGRPVIATTAGGLREVLGDGGILVPASDPESLAAAIERVLSDPDLAKRLGQAGQDRAQSQFSVQVIAARLLSRYQSQEKQGAV